MKREYLKLYAVTDRPCLREGVTLIEAVRKALQGGVTMVQYREKSGVDEETRLRDAVAIRDLCRKYGAPFLIDDDIDLALKLDADGVHVGQDDTPASETRKRIGPDRILGVTAKTIDQAMAAEAAGADYLGSGAMFTTGTKADAKPMTKETLRSIAGAVSIPVCAIGGIDEGNILDLKGTGISGVAVASGIFGSEDIGGTCQILKDRIETILTMERK